MRKRFFALYIHTHTYTVHLIMSPQFDIFDDNVKVSDHVVVEHLAPGQMWTKTSRLFQNDTRRVVLGSVELLNNNNNKTTIYKAQ